VEALGNALIKAVIEALTEALRAGMAHLADGCNRPATLSGGRECNVITHIDLMKV
jgi:hypothetical protein